MKKADIYFEAMKTRDHRFDGKSAVVQRAVKVLNSQEIIEFNEDEFAEKFGVTARHLRRLFVEEIGKTPKQLSFDNRLNLARKLITQTALPITELAFAAGFSSIRRFNDAFKDRFKKVPRDIRRDKVSDAEGLTVTLAYRPPFDFSGLMKSKVAGKTAQPFPLFPEFLQ